MHTVRTASRRALAAAGLLLLVGAGTARGDGCSDCGPPSDAAFRGAMGNIFRDFGTLPDYYEYDGGECDVAVGPVTQRKLGEEILALASGEAFFCPWGKVVSQVTCALTLTSEYEWSLKTSVGGEFGASVLAKLKASVEAGTGGSEGTGTQTEIRQTISANWCSRLPWIAFFVVGQFEATADYTVSRRFRWWIKNASSGSTVIAAGDVYLTCASGTATMGRLWPISATVGVQRRSCGKPCSPLIPQTIFHPPLPDGLEPPLPWPPAVPEDEVPPLGPDEPGPPPGPPPPVTPAPGTTAPAPMGRLPRDARGTLDALPCRTVAPGAAA